MATERTAAADVDEAVGAVESAARTFTELAVVHASANDAPRPHAPTKDDRRQPAAPPRHPTAAFPGQPSTPPGEGQLSQQARQSVATTQQHGVEVDRALGLVLCVEVAGDADPSPINVGLEGNGEEEQDVDDGQDNDDDERRGRGDWKTTERSHLLIHAGRFHPTRLKAADKPVEETSDDPVTGNHAVGVDGRRWGMDARRRAPVQCLPPLASSDCPGGGIVHTGHDPVQCVVERADGHGSGHTQRQYTQAGPVETVLGPRQSPAGRRNEVALLVLLER